MLALTLPGPQRQRTKGCNRWDPFPGWYLIDSDDFAACFLYFPGLLQEVPKAGFGDLSVGSKDAHSVEIGGRVVFGGELAPNDLVLVKTRHFVGPFVNAICQAVSTLMLSWWAAECDCYPNRALEGLIWRVPLIKLRIFGFVLRFHHRPASFKWHGFNHPLC